MSKDSEINHLAKEMKLPLWAEQMNDWSRHHEPFLFILDFDLDKSIVLPLKDVASTGIRFDLNASTSSSFSSGEEIGFSKYPVDFDTYQQGFKKVMTSIQAGDTYLLNLCYATKMTGLPSLDKIYESARAPYKLLVPGKFVVFSPEQFVSISRGIIRTFPMKGTIDASLPDAQATLLADIKEQEEHATVVDLLRNDLSIVARSVKVNRYRFISEIKTKDKILLQCSSEISGELEDEFKENLGSVLHALLPAGSVTGAPKKKTVEIIKRTEQEPRGYYTGVFGIFDGEKMDSAVMIRLIEERKDGHYYRSGGGITYRSQVQSEYQEMIDKVYVPVS
jgi:para-aminobenzoate synthetase component 1